MTEKQAILRDLKVIAILNNKIDYSDHDNIGAVLELNPKSLFSTEYGQRYLDRIRAMYDGKEYEHTCILCGSPLKDDNPVCENCYKMITLGNAVAPKKPENVVSEETEHAVEATAESTDASKDATETAPVVESESSTETEAAVSETAEAAETAVSVAETETNESVSEPETAPVAGEETASSAEETSAETEAAPEEAAPEETQASEVAQTVETAPAAEAETTPASTGETTLDAEAKTAATETEPAAESADTSEEQASDDDDKSSDDIDLNHGSEGSVKGEKMLELSKALILLFVIMCFTIAIVCGVVLGIRNLRIKNQKHEQEQSRSEAIIKDADLRDYYSMISSNVDHTLAIKADS